MGRTVLCAQVVQDIVFDPDILHLIRRRRIHYKDAICAVSINRIVENLDIQAGFTVEAVRIVPRQHVVVDNDVLYCEVTAGRKNPGLNSSPIP